MEDGGRRTKVRQTRGLGGHDIAIAGGGDLLLLGEVSRCDDRLQTLA